MFHHHHAHTIQSIHSSFLPSIISMIMTARDAPGLNGNVIHKVVRLEGLSNFDSATLLLQALPMDPQNVHVDPKTGMKGMGIGWKFLKPLQGNPKAILEFKNLHLNDVRFDIAEETDDEIRNERAKVVYQNHILHILGYQYNDGSSIGAGIGFGSSTFNGYFEPSSLESSFALASLALSDSHDTTMDRKSINVNNQILTMPSNVINNNELNNQELNTQGDDYDYDMESINGYDVSEHSVNNYDVSEYNVSEYTSSVYNPQLPPRQPQQQPQRRHEPIPIRRNDFKTPSHLFHQPSGTGTAAATVARSQAHSHATMFLRQPLLEYWKGIISLPLIAPIYPSSKLITFNPSISSLSPSLSASLALVSSS